MTEEEYKQYYADQLILQYKTQQKARATVSALVSQSPAVNGVNGKVQYSVVGTPTIENGIVSNLNENNYLILTSEINTADVQTLEVQVKFTTGSSFNHTYEGVIGTAYGTFGFYITQEGVLRGVYLDSVGTHDNPISSGIQPDTTYWAKMVVSEGLAILSISFDGTSWYDTTFTAADQQPVDVSSYFMASTYPFTGSIDLNETYIKINNKSWFGYTLIPVDLPNTIINGYDLDTAEGSVLDIIGKYVGLNRTVKALIGNTNTNVLNDDQYRLLLRLKLIKNTNFSSTSQLKTALYAWFPTSIRLFDNRDMTYEYHFSSLFNGLIDVLIAEEIVPVPMALGYTCAIVPNLLELYGYSDYGGLNNNPNGYSSYQTGFKGRWLSYGDKFSGEE